MASDLTREDLEAWMWSEHAYNPSGTRITRLIALVEEQARDLAHLGMWAEEDDWCPLCDQHPSTGHYNCPVDKARALLPKGE